MTASTACAIHCALLPLVFTLLPILGLGFLAAPWFENGMLAFAVLTGCVSLLTAYFRHHRRSVPLWILLAGFAFLLAGRTSGEGMYEAILVSLGGFMIAGAHFLNWRLMRNCSHRHTGI
ncbi:MAG: MerC domain-containing protein [Mucilaginibacter polytrichastri]|nr:MerC domain-containing protein [Mucilaginibacter polytrichastri]